jgi:DNA repair exonuclease SbcCD ATPase subunit
MVRKGFDGYAHCSVALRSAEAIADHKKRLKANREAKRNQLIAKLKADLKQVKAEKADLQAKLKAKAKKAQTRHVKVGPSCHASWYG